jgi:pilus assembly protein Flp/PilA
VAGRVRYPVNGLEVVLIGNRNEDGFMKSFKNALASFLRNEDGPTAVEYAVMLALIIVVCITAITALGSNANNTFSYVGAQVGKTGGS